MLGLMYSYNLLPQLVVDSKCVKTFQRKLQKAVKSCALSGSVNWESMLKLGARGNGSASFRKWFR